MWWQTHKFNEKRPFLKARQGVMASVRGFFDAAGFDAVETPILQVCPVMDAHIRAFGTDLRGVDGAVSRRMYLHTSPEFAMKKLMVAGVEKLYQICPVFRNAEGSPRHSPEFTILEWYRAKADYTDIMSDCEDLLRHVARALNISIYRFKDHVCDPFAAWERLSVADAFQTYAGIDLSAVLEDTESFRSHVRGIGLRAADDDGWDDLFFRVMDAKIEPHLGMGRPTILHDYPVSMASLSRRKASDPRYAERFELYVCGIELANAFSELTDSAEQRTRFQMEMDIKERLYGERYPVDEDFIQALEQGLPESGGIALGLDRLVMLATAASDIDQVLWCGRP
jgi:lysyl-tRNA synthetase class 2